MKKMLVGGQMDKNHCRRAGEYYVLKAFKMYICFRYIYSKHIFRELYELIIVNIFITIVFTGIQK